VDPRDAIHPWWGRQFPSTGQEREATTAGAARPNADEERAKRERERDHQAFMQQIRNMQNVQMVSIGNRQAGQSQVGQKIIQSPFNTHLSQPLRNYEILRWEGPIRVDFQCEVRLEPDPFERMSDAQAMRWCMEQVKENVRRLLMKLGKVIPEDQAQRIADLESQLLFTSRDLADAREQLEVNNGTRSEDAQGRGGHHRGVPEEVL
jgi:hypothetical protein